MAFPEDAPTKALRGFSAPLEPSANSSLISRKAFEFNASLNLQFSGLN